jgi:hypothetical protein
VVVDREALCLRSGDTRVALGTGRAPPPAGKVQVSTDGGAVVTGDAAAAPAEVVRGGEVGEEAKALRVTEVQARLLEARRIDNERRLAVLLLRLD